MKQTNKSYLSLKLGGKQKYIKEIDVFNSERVEGRYKTYSFQVYRDDEDWGMEDTSYYIHAYNPEISFGTIHDGWAKSDCLEGAVREMIESVEYVPKYS